MENCSRRRGSISARGILLLLTALCFLSVSAFVGGELRDESGRAADAYLYLLEPTLLLIAAYGLWRSGPIGDTVALLASGWVVYALVVDILWSMAAHMGMPILSGRAMKEFWRVMFAEWRHYPDRPYYFMLVTLGVLILSYSVASKSRTLLRKPRVTATGI